MSRIVTSSHNDPLGIPGGERVQAHSNPLEVEGMVVEEEGGSKGGAFGCQMWMCVCVCSVGLSCPLKLVYLPCMLCNSKVRSRLCKHLTLLM